jgi:hypothetical protein
MAATDWIEWDDLDERDWTEPVTCKRCGARDLTWDFVGDWQLFNADGNKHRCYETGLAKLAAVLKKAVSK